MLAKAFRWILGCELVEVILPLKKTRSKRLHFSWEITTVLPSSGHLFLPGGRGGQPSLRHPPHPAAGPGSPWSAPSRTFCLPAVGAGGVIRELFSRHKQDLKAQSWLHGEFVSEVNWCCAPNRICKQCPCFLLLPALCGTPCQHVPHRGQCPQWRAKPAEGSLDSTDL